MNTRAAGPSTACRLRRPRSPVRTLWPALGPAALALALLVSTGARAQAQAARGDASADGLQLRSCVRGSPPLRLPATVERAALDPADARSFDTAAQARYPLYQRGGQAPTQVLLLRRDGQWLYVTLWHDGQGPCFNAVFAADRFSFTPAWLARYRPRASDSPD